MNSSAAFIVENIFRVDTMEILGRIISQGLHTGIHPSRRSGYSDEFHDYRTYSGEDIKYIDWKLFARTDKLFLRKYRERITSSIYVYLDASVSMDFGTTISKGIFSRYIAAALAILTSQQGDALTMKVVQSQIQTICSSSHARQALRSVYSYFEKMNENGVFDIAAFATDVVHIKNSIVFLLSDLWCRDDELLQTMNELRSRNNDVVILHILSPHELDIGKIGVAQYNDSETGASCVCKASDIHAMYNHEMKQRISFFRNSFAYMNIRYIQVCSADYIPAVICTLLR